jgi:hypothetical protein
VVQGAKSAGLVSCPWRCALPSLREEEFGRNALSAQATLAPSMWSRRAESRAKQAKKNLEIGMPFVNTLAAITFGSIQCKLNLCHKN